MKRSRSCRTRLRCLAARKASTFAPATPSQNRLPRAARIMDLLEEQGVIGAAGSKAREILIESMADLDGAVYEDNDADDADGEDVAEEEERRRARNRTTTKTKRREDA